MADVGRLVGWFDAAQQRRPWLGYPLAVARKFGDDSGSDLAGLVAYYGFAAIFPLLLVLTTVLGYVLSSDPALQERLLGSAVADFPVVGDQLRTAGLHGHWYVIVISGLISVWGARGMANALQNAFNTVWAVPFADRSGFGAAIGRSLALIAVLGIAVMSTGLLSGIGGAANVLGVATRVGALAASAAINIAVFMLGFRLATARQVPLSAMLRSAIVSAIIWQALLVAGTFLLAHQVRHAQELYGTFGVVLGLLAWLHLQARLMLYAVEADVVRARRLWPRGLQPPLTRADMRAYRSYAATARRRPTSEQRIDVEFTDGVTDGVTADAVGEQARDRSPD
jgi:YihY family inner membrane protein